MPPLTPEERVEIRKSVELALNSKLVQKLLEFLDLPNFLRDRNARMKDREDEIYLAKIFQMSQSEERKKPTAEQTEKLIAEERKKLIDILQDIETEFKSRIKGQDHLIRTMLMSLVLNEHALLEGLPGVGKTEIVKWIDHVTGLPFSRVQFIPDMLPSDLIGKDHIDVARLNAGEADAVQWTNGPIFTSLLLADEINRAPSKVQSALLEGMGEKQVTPFGKISRPVLPPLHKSALKVWQQIFPGKEIMGIPAIPLDRKDLAQFTTFATMNPIEQEGTYPLSEAQQEMWQISKEEQDWKTAVEVDCVSNNRELLAELRKAHWEALINSACESQVKHFVTYATSALERYWIKVSQKTDMLREIVTRGNVTKARVEIFKVQRSIRKLDLWKRICKIVSIFVTSVRKKRWPVFSPEVRVVEITCSGARRDLGIVFSFEARETTASALERYEARVYLICSDSIHKMGKVEVPSCFGEVQVSLEEHFRENTLYICAGQRCVLAISKNSDSGSTRKMEIRKQKSNDYATLVAREAHEF